MEKKNAKQEMIRELRQKAEQTLRLCNEAEEGKISAEEFEKRVSKLKIGPISGPVRKEL